MKEQRTETYRRLAERRRQRLQAYWRAFYVVYIYVLENVWHCLAHSYMTFMWVLCRTYIINKKIPGYDPELQRALGGWTLRNRNNTKNVKPVNIIYSNFEVRQTIKRRMKFLEQPAQYPSHSVSSLQVARCYIVKDLSPTPWVEVTVKKKSNSSTRSDNQMRARHSSK